MAGLRGLARCGAGPRTRGWPCGRGARTRRRDLRDAACTTSRARARVRRVVRRLGRACCYQICEPNCPPNLPAINQQQRQPACNSSCNNNHLDSEVPSRSFVVAAQACCVYLRRQRCCRPYTPFRVVHGVPRVPHAARGRGAPVQRGPASSPRTLLTPTLKPQPLTLTL